MENNLIAVENVRGYVDDNGVVMLNAEDVARGWGFTRNKNGESYVMWDRVNRYLGDFGFSTQVRKDDYIPENMVYRLGFKASNEVAQRFQTKLADEILPSIRKHGAYMTEETLEKALTSPDFLIRLATELKHEKEARLKAEEKIEIDRPKVQFANSVSGSPTSIPVGDLAKIMKQNGVNIGQNRLFAWLRNNGWLMKDRESWNMPMQKGMNMGYFEIKETTSTDQYGVAHINKRAMVTGKGQVYFLNKMLSAA